MKVEVMRRLVLEADTHQIDDKIIDAAKVETMADIDKLIVDFNATLKAAWSKDEVQAEEDITAWSAKK